jgi:hypothetical protein
MMHVVKSLIKKKNNKIHKNTEFPTFITNFYMFRLHDNNDRHLPKI